MRTMGFAAKIFRPPGAGDDDRGGAIVHSGSIAGSDRAVFLKCWFQRAQNFDRGVFARRFVFVEDDRGCAFFLRREFNGNDL